MHIRICEFYEKILNFLIILQKVFNSFSRVNAASSVRNKTFLLKELKNLIKLYILS